MARRRPSFARGIAGAHNSQRPGLWKGLIGAWVPALGATGATLQDVSGRRHPGTLTNMDPETDWIPSGSAHLPGYALDYDAASGQYVNVSLSDRGFLGGLTIVTWARITTGSAFRQFAGKHAGSGSRNSPFDFRTNNAATPLLTCVRAHATGNKSWASTQAVLLGDWAQYTVTFADGLIETAPLFYVDAGAPDVGSGGGASAGPITGSDAPIRIGERADDVLGMVGAIGSTLIWDHALTPADISDLAGDPLALFRIRPRVIRAVQAAAPAVPVEVPELFWQPPIVDLVGWG